MKKNIEVYEGLIKLSHGSGWDDPSYYMCDDYSFDEIARSVEGKRVRITIEELEEKE